jgi:hypothetical protein
VDTKRARREARLRAEDLERYRVAVSTPRDPSDDIFYPGVGFLLCQVVRIPSFTPAICFDVRSMPGPFVPDGSRSPGSLRLFVADGGEPGGRLVRGYAPIALREDVLASFLSRLAATSLPTVPEEPTFGVADGIQLEVAVTTGLGSLRASWSEGAAPAGWNGLETLAREMLSTFATWTRQNEIPPLPSDEAG